MPARSFTTYIFHVDDEQLAVSRPVAQRPDTVVRYVERPRRAPRQVASRQAEPPATGRSVAEDNIDYSMLVMR